MATRVGWLAACFVFLAAGCSSSSRLTVRPEATPTRVPEPIAHPVAAESIERINRNAQPIEGMTASTTVSMVRGSRLGGGGVSGRLTLERPRNFSLVLERGLGTRVVDVGSNDREFWFWTKDSDDKAIYVGEYDSQGALPAEVLVQPEWIVEALGLRVLPPTEVGRTRVDRGREAGTIVLTHDRSDASGKKTIKRTVLDAQTHQIRQHLFYRPGESSNPVAVVTPSNYKSFPIDTESAGGTESMVELPQRIQLRLASQRSDVEPVVMDLALRDLSLNPPITDTNREALFSVPTYDGNQVVTITPSRSAYAAQPRPRDNTRDPAASLSGDLQPAEPAPMGVDGASLNWKDPMPLDSDLSPALGPMEPAGTEAIVRRQAPRAPGSPDPAAPTSPPRRVSLGSGFN